MIRKTHIYYHERKINMPSAISSLSNFSFTTSAKLLLRKCFFELFQDIYFDFADVWSIALKVKMSRVSYIWLLCWSDRNSFHHPLWLMVTLYYSFFKTAKPCVIMFCFTGNICHRLYLWCYRNWNMTAMFLSSLSKRLQICYELHASVNWSLKI